MPIAGQRIFFGDHAAGSAYDEAIARAAALGAQIIDIDIEPFYETARLLYEGPWVAERYIVLKSLLASSPNSIHPVTKEVIMQGARPTAVDTFSAFYKLEELRRVRDVTFRQIDALLLPTAPTAYTVKQVLADPIQLNSRLGTYTNFVNLLDLCGLAVPSSMRDGRHAVRHHAAGAGGSRCAAGIHRARHSMPTPPCRWARSKMPQPPLAPLAPARKADEIAIAVVGAHLSGMPLNGELKSVRPAFSKPQPPRPTIGFLPSAARCPGRACCASRRAPVQAIELEIWAMPAEGFGRFVARYSAAAQSIGTLRLADGRTVKGFLVEVDAIAAREDISRFGGWRNYVARDKVPAA